MREHFNIRKAEPDDLERLTSIYNEAILEKFKTAHTETFTADERSGWFNSHDQFHPIFVCEYQDQVAGYLALSPYRSGRSALRNTVEISYYVAVEMRGKGVAQELFSHALKFATHNGFKTLIAILIERNIESRTFLEKNEFEQWGYLPAVAEFYGEVCAHLYYGRRIQ